MEGIAENKGIALEIADLLDKHLGEDTIVLELGEASSWADYFIITTVRSNTHLSGLIKNLHLFFKEKKIVPLNSYRNIDFKGWALIDLGAIVVHLMDREKRDFYQLEKLWFKSEVLYHSSKSSKSRSSSMS